MPTTRSGNPGGILNTNIRGFVVKDVSLPITFEFDSTTFDEAGETYAQALSEHLQLIGAENVTLVRAEVRNTILPCPRRGRRR